MDDTREHTVWWHLYSLDNLRYLIIIIIMFCEVIIYFFFNELISFVFLLISFLNKNEVNIFGHFFSS